MSEKLREQLSALMDGELDDGEAKLLLRRLSKNPELRDAWDRYHRCTSLIGASDRAGGAYARLGRDFTDRVMARIAEEGKPPVTGGKWRDWLRPAAGIAVAAGVATVALLGLQGERFTNGPGSAEVVPGTSAESRTWQSPARFSPAAADGSMSAEERDSWRRLNTYRMNHADQTAGLERLEAADTPADEESERDPDGIRAR